MTRTPPPHFVHEKPPEKQECPDCGGCFGLHFRWRCKWAQFRRDLQWDRENARFLRAEPQRLRDLFCGEHKPLSAIGLWILAAISFYMVFFFARFVVLDIPLTSFLIRSSFVGSLIFVGMCWAMASCAYAAAFPGHPILGYCTLLLMLSAVAIINAVYWPSPSDPSTTVSVLRIATLVVGTFIGYVKCLLGPED